MLGIWQGLRQKDRRDSGKPLGLNTRVLVSRLRRVSRRNFGWYRQVHGQSDPVGGHSLSLS